MDLLICPVCKKGLHKENNTLKCVNNHSFDFAKEQYVNLYHNKGIHSGDDANMIKARNEFLNKGYYLPIANGLVDLIDKDHKKDITILDVGCGDGYYLNQLYNSFKDQFKIDYYGFDLSKKGIQIAAKRNPNIHFFVANANDIPIKSKSIDYFINMFSYFNQDEMARVLKSDGEAIIFRAGVNHLYEMKDILYDTLFLKEHPLIIDSPQLFIKEQRTLKTKIWVNNKADLANLLLMTPHYWKTKQENKDVLLNHEILELTLEIELYIIKKMSS